MKRNHIYIILIAVCILTACWISGKVFFSGASSSVLPRKGQLSPNSKETGKRAVTGRRSITGKEKDFDSKYIKADEHSTENIRKIVGLDKSVSFRTRLKLVNSLSRNLSSIEKSNLYYYLRFGENNTQTHVLKNDILNALRDQKIPPPELTDVMLDLFYDKSQDIVVRSYALQHMRPWYTDEKMKDEKIRKAFYDGLKEIDTEISGVSLLALRRLSELEPEFEPMEIASKAVELASNDNAYVLSRISAIGVCGQMKTAEILPVARKIAVSNANTGLKLASIASLGEIGQKRDVIILTGLTRKPIPVSTAAIAALRKLKRKLYKIRKEL
jgi:hypothetical protein